MFRTVTLSVSKLTVSTCETPLARAMTEAIRGKSGWPFFHLRTSSLLGSSRTTEWSA